MYTRAKLAARPGAYGSSRHLADIATLLTRLGRRSAARLFGRFSTSVRLFASACAGCARITYRRYVALDGAGI
jgi:membrane protein DedA with SNARE-associated domain